MTAEAAIPWPTGLARLSAPQRDVVRNLFHVLKADRPTSQGCLLWQGELSYGDHGYPRIRLPFVTIAARQIAWAEGRPDEPVPRHIHVLCKVQECVTAHHLASYTEFYRHYPHPSIGAERSPSAVWDAPIASRTDSLRRRSPWGETATALRLPLPPLGHCSRCTADGQYCPGRMHADRQRDIWICDACPNFEVWGFADDHSLEVSRLSSERARIASLGTRSATEQALRVR
jgi:hypothetical protein